MRYHIVPSSPSQSRRLPITMQKKADADLAKAREAEKAARSYDNVQIDEDDDQPQQSVQEMMDDFM